MCLVNLVRETIQSYCLIEDNEPVVIGLSGGKDSIFLSIVMKHLGYKVYPVVVDVGFGRGRIDEVLRLCDDLEIECRVLSIEDDSILSAEDLSFISKRYKALKENGGVQSHNNTPCTLCYNVKIVALNAYCRHVGARKIALGHHYNDVVVSFLKTVFYYIDRWCEGNRVFDKNKFTSIVDQYAKVFLDANFIQTDKFREIESMVMKKVVSTEEPPKSIVIYENNKVDIIRPLFFVLEKDILCYYKLITNYIDIQGCIFRDYGCMTPREIVKKKIVDVMFSGGDIYDYSRFRELILNNVSKDGYLIEQVRNKRDEILGEEYKECFDKIKI